MRSVAVVAAASLALVPLTLAPARAAAQTGLSRLWSCEQSGQKQEGGAVVGALLGAALGSQVSKNERALGAVAGAALGAAAGSYIGCRMQSTDQARAQAATKLALDHGASQNWSNPQTGASGRIDVLSSSYGPPVTGSSLRFAPRVQMMSSYDALGGQYYAPGQVNLRAGPSTRDAVVGKLAAGERFDALGATTGGGWILVGRNGMAAGYVAATVVRASGTPLMASCRMVQTTTTLRGAAVQSQRYNACRDTRGEWQLTAV
jgi:surface antigen